MSTTGTHRELRQGIRYLVELVPAGEEFMFYARQVERMAVERTPIINPSADAIAAWVAFANDGTAAEAAVVRHLYLLSRGEGPDPLVAQVHPVSEPEPARVIDGLTVGARYLVALRDESSGECEFVGVAEREALYRFRRFDLTNFFLRKNDVAIGAAVVTDVDGNRVDYWAERARAFIADGRALGMTDDDFGSRPIRSRTGMAAAEPATFHALPRVLDEQESTR